MKSTLVLVAVALVLKICIATPSLKETSLLRIPPGEFGNKLIYEVFDDRKSEEFLCDEEHTEDPWGPKIPKNLQEQTKLINWEYNKYLGNITKNYWRLVNDREVSASVNRLPAPKDQTFNEIIISSSGIGWDSKMYDAKTENLNTLQNKSLDMNFETETASLSMASNETIKLNGYYVDFISGKKIYCNVTLKPGIAFRVLMSLTLDKEKQYSTQLDFCYFNISEKSDAMQECSETRNVGVDNNNRVSVTKHRDPEDGRPVLNAMAKLMCQKVYYKQVKDEVEQQILLWDPSKRAEIYASTEIHQLMTKFSEQRLRNHLVNVTHECYFKKNGFEVKFENIKLQGAGEMQFRPAAPTVYSAASDHHIETVLTMCKPLASRFMIQLAAGYGNYTVEQWVPVITPVRIIMHFSSNIFGKHRSFILRYHPDVMIGGTYLTKASNEYDDCSIRETIISLNKKYRPAIVSALIAYVQEELFNFLYPGALQKPDERVKRLHYN